MQLAVSYKSMLRYNGFSDGQLHGFRKSEKVVVGVIDFRTRKGRS